VSEFGSGVGCGELPVDLSLVGVGGVLPGGEFVVEGVQVGDAPAQALPGQAGQFDLGDVEPGAVFGGVVDLQALGEGVGLRRLYLYQDVPNMWDAWDIDEHYRRALHTGPRDITVSAASYLVSRVGSDFLVVV